MNREKNEEDMKISTGIHTIHKDIHNYITKNNINNVSRNLSLKID